ncbi:porin family protein [Flavobacterium sp. 5]|uniref:porin family protein n=1 Tax=Flavobacterium sp. 5 TaxID=2035199 RepID=UPI000C2B8063|nr:porin family protein [Flavobacterium sp. 5]PKB16738.1 outer membrane protein with beta-barrel domain [Flavobacterium sp. 5]
MKKILLPLVALISFGFANAQSKGKGTIEITPKIGFSSFSESNPSNGIYSSNTDTNSGVEFGGTADYYFNNRWSLRSGLVFDKMGGKYYDWDGFVYEDKLNYLSIPINANWHFGSTRKWNLNFGFSPSFLLDAKANNKEIPKSHVESFQLGLTYGIGYKIEINKKFGVLLDYQGFNGLTNINKANSTNIKNVGYSINVGGVIEL